jgi:transposase InsO family protein
MAAHFAVSFQANTSDVHAHGEWPVQITSGRRGSASRLRVIGDWISFYNNRRPHQALAMRTPAEAFRLAA